MKRTIALLVALFVLSILCLSQAGAAESQPASDFILPGLLDTNVYSLKDLRGKIVLLNIWASWCSGCREEMEGLMTVQEQLGEKGFVIVAVNIDNSVSKAIDFVNSLEAKTGKKTGFTLLYDNDKAVARDFRQRAMPTSYLIDREGRIVKTYPGSFSKSSLAALKTAIEGMMK